MAKARTYLLLFLVLLVAIAVAMSLLLKVYLSRPEAIARISELLSRSLGMKIAIGQVEVPWIKTGLGSIVLQDIAFSGPRVDGDVSASRFHAQRMQLRLQLLPLLRRELRFRSIEVEGAEIRFEGAPIEGCDGALASLDRALGGWADLVREAHRFPVERLTLMQGSVDSKSFRLTDVELQAEGWGSQALRIRLLGKFAFPGGSLPFQAEAQASPSSEPSGSDSIAPGNAQSGRSPFHMDVSIRLERIPLAPLQVLYQTLDLQTARATAVLTLVVSSGNSVGGAFEAKAVDILTPEGHEPWDPTLRVHFQVEPAKAEAAVSEALLTAPGIQAKGEGRISCTGKGINYAIQAKDIAMDLGKLRGMIPDLPKVAGGHVVVQALGVTGMWPDQSPELALEGRVERMGPFPFGSIRLLNLEGRWQVQGNLDRLSATTAFKGTVQGGEAETFPMALTGRIQGSLRSGDFTLEPFAVEADSLGKVDFTGRLKQWGKASTELVTQAIHLDLAALNRRIAFLRAGLEVETLERPSLRLILKGRDTLWDASTEFHALSLRISGRSAALQGVQVGLHGRGMKEMEGTVLGNALAVDGHPLEGLRVTLGFHDGRLSIKELRATAYGGKVRAEGPIALAFENGLLKIPEFSLSIGDQAHISLTATLPLESGPGRVPSLKLALPAISIAALQQAMPALLSRIPIDGQLAGTLEGKVDMAGDQLQGEARLQGVDVDGGIVSLEGANGRIPLVGTLGVSSRAVGEGWPALSEQAYREAVQALRQSSSSPSFTISSIRYAGFELKDLAVHFSPRGGVLAIDHLEFQGLGGNGGGRGAVDLLGGSLHLALLVEGVSLREICNRFPPIKGYISGKVNGMLELSLPLFEPSRAEGRARFWAVASDEEPREISKALIERLGKPSGWWSSLIALRGDRPYDHSLLEVTLKDRALIFHRLEISNTTFFIKDLDIKVIAPYNTITIQDLFDTIEEAWRRFQT